MGGAWCHYRCLSSFIFLSRFHDPKVRLTIGLVALIPVLNSTMLAIALPSIGDNFNVGVGSLTLLVSGYLLPVAVIQPISGRLGDAFGTRKIMLIGLVLIIPCSILAAFAWSFPILVLGRVLMGFACALVIPTPMAYLRKYFRGTNRLGLIVGTQETFLNTTAAVGPLIGGLLLFAGWQFVFFLNLPLALFALFLLLRLKSDQGNGIEELSLNFVSIILLIFVLGSLIFSGFIGFNENPFLAIAAVLFSVASAIAYWLYFRRTGDEVANLTLFTRRNYATSAIGMALSNFIFYSLLFGVPLYLIEVRGIGDQISSLLLIGISIGAFLSSPLGGILSDRYGRRFPVVLGSILMLLGCSVLAIILKAPVIVLLVPFVCIGLGLGQASTARYAAALEAWPPNVAGSASGTFIMFRYLGSIVGLAVMASVLGKMPSISTFQMLFVVLSCLGILHLVTGVVMKSGKVNKNSLIT